MHEILNFQFWDNTVQRWLEFAALVAFTYIIKKYLSNFLGTILYQPFRKFSTENEGKKFVALLSNPIEFLILFLTVFFAFKTLHYPTSIDIQNEDFNVKKNLNQILKTIGAISVTWVILRIVDFLSFVFYQKYSSHEKGVDEQIVPFVKDSVKVVIVIIAIIFILGVIFKLNVASILAGVGIGGLAVALAAKESLENLLGSFTIFIDKPFQVGDVVQAGNVNGTVERVGFRSTRIRTENKTFVTVPNKQIVDSVLDNITERTHRRVETKLQLSGNTSSEKIEIVIENIAEKLSQQELVEPDFTVLFNQINANSLEVIISYLVKQTDMKNFNSIKQQINFSVINILQKEQVQFASLDTTSKNSL